MAVITVDLPDTLKEKIEKQFGSLDEGIIQIIEAYFLSVNPTLKKLSKYALLRLEKIDVIYEYLKLLQKGENEIFKDDERLKQRAQTKYWNEK